MVDSIDENERSLEHRLQANQNNESIVPSLNSPNQSTGQNLDLHSRGEGYQEVRERDRNRASDNPDESSRRGFNYPRNDDEAINRNLVSDLQAHLYDTQISDVTFRGTDDRTVVAIRSILAMRSRYFKSLLFGNFQERNLKEVPLGFSSLVLRAVVEYCYTDEMKITFENLSFEETARSMVGLVSAGSYFELGGLLSQAYRLTCLMMDEYPALACSVLDEAVSGANKCTQTEELSRVALGIIRLRAESALLPPDTYGAGVHSLGEAAIELVMSDEKIQTDELTLFYCLKKWAEHEPESRDKKEIPEQRLAVARRLSSHIDFSKVAPTDLATTVSNADFVPLEVMALAYKTQALQAERKGMNFCQMRTVEHAINGRVMVQGAGLSDVNGAYLSTSARNTQFQKYSKDGCLPGYGAGKFLLHTLTMHDDSKKWLLSFHHGLDQLIDLYSAPVISDEIVPPMQKWVACLATHEKLRRNASRNKLQKKTSHHTHLSQGESENSGDPPPICIWLPGDPSDVL